MEIVIWRVRLSVLWLFAAGGWLVSFSINLLMPGVVQHIMGGQIGDTPITEGRMVFYALLYLIPFAMAVLSLSLNDSFTRWLNISVGMVFGIVMVLDLIMHLANWAKGGQESLAIWLMMTTGVLASALITSLACKYPKQQQ